MIPRLAACFLPAALLGLAAGSIRLGLAWAAATAVGLALGPRAARRLGGAIPAAAAAARFAAVLGPLAARARRRGLSGAAGLLDEIGRLLASEVR